METLDVVPARPDCLNLCGSLIPNNETVQPPEIRLYRLLGDNRVVSPPPVPVQNRRAVLSDAFPALQLPVDRRRGNAQPFGNVRRAFVRLIQRGNLPPVLKGYVFVVSRHAFTPFQLSFPARQRKNKCD